MKKVTIVNLKATSPSKKGLGRRSGRRQGSPYLGEGDVKIGNVSYEVVPQRLGRGFVPNSAISEVLFVREVLPPKGFRRPKKTELKETEARLAAMFGRQYEQQLRAWSQQRQQRQQSAEMRATCLPDELAARVAAVAQQVMNLDPDEIMSMFGDANSSLHSLSEDLRSSIDDSKIMDDLGSWDDIPEITYRRSGLVPQLKRKRRKTSDSE